VRVDSCLGRLIAGGPATRLGHARRVQPPDRNIEAMSVEGRDGSSEFGARPGVLVVGAGPTGLALAAQRDALGAAVRIVDRQLDRVHEARALVVLPRTLEVLRGLGVSERLVERGHDAVQLQIHFGKNWCARGSSTSGSRTPRTHSCFSSRRPRPRRC
jgi:FAD binding domain